MSARSAHGGASAPSNVVRLPTAAPRQVRQRWNRQTRELHEQLPQFPRERSLLARKPWLREDMRQAELLLNAGEAADRSLARMIFRALDDATKRKVELFLCLDTDRKSSREALAWVRFAMADHQRQQDITRACQVLLEGE